MISYGKQSINQSDIDTVVKVLKGDWLTQGPAIEKFAMLGTFKKSRLNLGIPSTVFTK